MGVNPFDYWNLENYSGDIAGKKYNSDYSHGFAWSKT